MGTHEDGFGYVVCPLLPTVHRIPVVYHIGQMRTSVVKAIDHHLSYECEGMSAVVNFEPSARPGKEESE